MIREALGISIKVSLIATIICLVAGLIITRGVINIKGKLKDILEVLILFPMFLPPSVVGYIILITIGKESFIGKFILSSCGISLIFTWKAGVIACIIVSFPMMYQSLKAALLNIDNIYIEAARVMGATEFQIFFKIIVPLAVKGVVSGIVLTFGRAFGEFGATMMVAGNIPGKTQTLPMAMYYAVESGEILYANKILIIIMFISFSMVLLLNYVLRKNNH